MKKKLTLFLVLTLIIIACQSSTKEALLTNGPGFGITSLKPIASPEASATSSEPPPFGEETEFKTDFSKHSIPYSEIISGGPRKDDIPAINSPKFITVQEAGDWLVDVEPVIFVQVGDDARAYPIQILIWHEIVNDTVGGLPLAVTFCPLCNTGIAFEREVNGRVLDFGTTGRLRYSNLIMYDRQTETWWQQGTGEAIVGEMLGIQLAFYPVSIIAWSDFAVSFPEGKVLSKETGYNRQYGNNPYFGYDDINNSPFLFQGETPNKLAAMERILALEINGDVVAYPFSLLNEVQVVQDVVGGEDIVVFWAPGVASALDERDIITGRDVGTANAYSSIHDGEQLTFSLEMEGRFRDNETGSVWNIFGKAIEGPLAGFSLKSTIAINHFWFDWVAFKPETRVYEIGK